jgi:hypothetical protein
MMRKISFIQFYSHNALPSSVLLLIQLFVAREFTKDMDMDVYNTTLDVLLNPKFAAYFDPVANVHAE